MYFWGAGGFIAFWSSLLSPIPPLELNLVGADGIIAGCWVGSKFVDGMLKPHKYWNVLFGLKCTPPRQKICPKWFGTPYCCYNAIMFDCCIGTTIGYISCWICGCYAIICTHCYSIIGCGTTYCPYCCCIGCIGTFFAFVASLAVPLVALPCSSPRAKFPLRWMALKLSQHTQPGLGGSSFPLFLGFLP